MGDKSPIPIRKRMRLTGFDYGRGYAYFITICIQGRLKLLGRIEHGLLAPSPAGLLIARIWEGLPEVFPGVVLDVFAVMPDHFHGIVGLIDPPVKSGPTQEVGPYENAKVLQPPTLIELLRRFKSFTQYEYGQGVRQFGWPPYSHHLWQRSYYEHVIRCEADLQLHQEYIYNNAIAWYLKH